MLGRLNQSDYCLIAICVLVIGAFFFYWYRRRPEFGARVLVFMIDFRVQPSQPGAF